MSLLQLDAMLAESGLDEVVAWPTTWVEDLDDALTALTGLDAPAPGARCSRPSARRPVEDIPRLWVARSRSTMASVLVLAVSTVGATGLSAAANTLPPRCSATSPTSPGTTCPSTSRGPRRAASYPPPRAGPVPARHPLTGRPAEQPARTTRCRGSRTPRVPGSVRVRGRTGRAPSASHSAHGSGNAPAEQASRPSAHAPAAPWPQGTESPGRRSREPEPGRAGDARRRHSPRPTPEQREGDRERAQAGQQAGQQAGEVGPGRPGSHQNGHRTRRQRRAAGGEGRELWSPPHERGRRVRRQRARERKTALPTARPTATAMARATATATRRHVAGAGPPPGRPRDRAVDPPSRTEPAPPDAHPAARRRRPRSSGVPRAPRWCVRRAPTPARRSTGSRSRSAPSSSILTRIQLRSSPPSEVWVSANAPVSLSPNSSTLRCPPATASSSGIS